MAIKLAAWFNAIKIRNKLGIFISAMCIMRKPVKNILRLFLITSLLFLAYLAGILVINSIYNYRPLGEDYEVDAFQNYFPVNSEAPYSVISWNIGYAGLGKDADFFYDGGRMSRPGKDQFIEYFNGIRMRLQSFDTVDFFLLQEVDLSSRRSYHLDQLNAISSLLPDHAKLFAVNYNVRFVPLPVFSPMGNVVSGLCLLGNKKVVNAFWHPFESDKSWPLGLFKPDRCYQVVVFDAEQSKRLYLVHTHNSAFDDGSMRDKQLKTLFAEMKHAYQQGHYVIAGGDWNLNPANWPGHTFVSGDPAFLLEQEAVLMPEEGWNIAFNPDYPSNRDVSRPYLPGVTPCTILDYFICSPNVKILETKTLYNNFEYSDHQPVYLRFELIP
jgi:endonuclease/exonuclease/phosphatase family metal-dependent hydrolase